MSESGRVSKRVQSDLAVIVIVIVIVIERRVVAGVYRPNSWTTLDCSGSGAVVGAEIASGSARLLLPAPPFPYGIQSP